MPVGPLLAQNKWVDTHASSSKLPTLMKNHISNFFLDKNTHFYYVLLENNQ